jgi:hypothetical protein
MHTKCCHIQHRQASEVTSERTSASASCAAGTVEN